MPAVHLEDGHKIRKRSAEQNLRIKLYYDTSVYKWVELNNEKSNIKVLIEKTDYVTRTQLNSTELNWRYLRNSFCIITFFADHFPNSRYVKVAFCDALSGQISIHR